MNGGHMAMLFGLAAAGAALRPTLPSYGLHPDPRGEVQEKHKRSAISRAEKIRQRRKARNLRLRKG